MAANNITVNTEGIDPVLKEANICLRELDHLHYVLNKGHVDTGMIEARVTLIFRNMMSSLYSVLDQVYYFLYCHYQNNGEASFAAETFQLNAPCKQDLKWSGKDTTDVKDQWSENRKNWLDEKCEQILGPSAPPESKTYLSQNLLCLQAVRKVNNAGQPVTNDGDISLVHFSSQSGKFQTLPSTNLDPDNWSDVTSFNLLHFYRNFTTHRTLLHTAAYPGYWNWRTREFVPEERLGPEWDYIALGNFIMVPELSHLRDKNRTDPPKFHLKPLMRVCSSFVHLVKSQRDNLVRQMQMPNHDYPVYPYAVTLSKGLAITKNGQPLWSCSWKDWHATRLLMG